MHPRPVPRYTYYTRHFSSQKQMYMVLSHFRFQVGLISHGLPRVATCTEALVAALLLASVSSAESWPDSAAVQPQCYQKVGAVQPLPSFLVHP